MSVVTKTSSFYKASSLLWIVKSLTWIYLQSFKNIYFVAEKIERTVQIEASTVEIEERGVKLRLTVVDTPGYGDAMNSQDWWVHFSRIHRRRTFLVYSLLLGLPFFSAELPHSNFILSSPALLYLPSSAFPQPHVSLWRRICFVSGGR